MPRIIITRAAHTVLRNFSTPAQREHMHSEPNVKGGFSIKVQWDVIAALKAQKAPEETFSDVIERLYAKEKGLN